jgi:heme exporter protein A
MSAASTAPAPSLAVRGLSCLRAGRVVFRDLDFDLRAGEALVLRGPNGSGKSSLLRLLAGLLRPGAGTIAWNGADIDADREAHRARVAYLGAGDALKPALSVAENLAFHAALRGGGGAATAAALAAVGLAELADQPARRLSQGQRRRAALARLAIAPAALWLLDEPTLALDDDAIGRLGTMLRAHLAAGGLAAIATHVDLPVSAAAVIEFAPP